MISIRHSNNSITMFESWSWYVMFEFGRAHQKFEKSIWEDDTKYILLEGRCFGCHFRSNGPRNTRALAYQHISTRSHPWWKRIWSIAWGLPWCIRRRVLDSKNLRGDGLNKPSLGKLKNHTVSWCKYHTSKCMILKTAACQVTVGLLGTTSSLDLLQGLSRQSASGQFGSRSLHYCHNWKWQFYATSK